MLVVVHLLATEVQDAAGSRPLVFSQGADRFVLLDVPGRWLGLGALLQQMYRPSIFLQKNIRSRDESTYL